jgi:hypothetical protein
MTEKSTPPERFSLSRWSRRKLEANAEPGARPSVAPGAVPANAMATASSTAPAPAPAAPPELPSVDSLNFDSDFTAFLRPEVDENLKRAALKQLFRDPRFNVMDGLDVYIDDYSIPDPIAPELVRQLAHARYLFDPPRTRVNEAGFVEDVPADEIDGDADAAPQEPLAGSATESPVTSSQVASQGSEPDLAEGSEKSSPPLEGSEPARQ